MPGVQSAAIASNPPLMTGWQSGFLPEGMPEPKPGEGPSMEVCIIQGDYFETLKTPVLRGRPFNEHDTKTAPPVIIIDSTTAEKFFPGQDPIGKRLRDETGGQGAVLRTIVGVVPRLKVYGFDEPKSALAQGYLPQTQQPNTSLVLLIRTSAGLRALDRPLRQAVATLDPAQPVFDFKTMQERVEETWATPRLMAFLLAMFAVLALTLAIVGLYGVMAYNALRRTREIGVRLALGARRRQISSMMVRQGMRLLVIGVAVGFAGAFMLARLIQSLLFQVTATDPAAYIGVTLILIAAALAACWIPARRAARVDPMIILRAE
jgi:predicted permease